jgi:hypothetical protein
MSETQFQINAPGIDTVKIVAEIQAEVSRKMAEGVYSDARVATAERHNLAHMADGEELLKFYLNCLRETVQVDISDWEIKDRRGGAAGGLLVKFKTTVWKLLKFYTYRLWSQQNQVNGLLHTAVESSFKNYERRISELEKRIEELEAK